MRHRQASEERDGSSNLSKLFFAGGQLNTATKYFYAEDHLGSCHQMCDLAGNVNSEYSFNAYGRYAVIRETIACDFGFTGMYKHVRSLLSFAKFRQYNSELARWVNRNRLEEFITTNLYSYVSNEPISYIDPLGLERHDCRCRNWWTTIIAIELAAYGGGLGSVMASSGGMSSAHGAVMRIGMAGYGFIGGVTGGCLGGGSVPPNRHFPWCHDTPPPPPPFVIPPGGTIFDDPAN